jgi:hypothetical protein
MALFCRLPVNGPGDAGTNAGPPQLAVPAPMVNSIDPTGFAGGGQPGASVVVEVVDVLLDDVVVGIGDVLELLVEVLVVLVEVVVGRGGQAPGAGAFLALNLPISSRVIVPPWVAQ